MPDMGFCTIIKNFVMHHFSKIFTCYRVSGGKKLTEPNFSVGLLKFPEFPVGLLTGGTPKNRKKGWD